MRNDIIELFTEIDDDLISSAMPEAQRPVEMRADTSRFSWKKFAAAAACLTAAAVGGTFALKALSGNGGIVSPGSITPSTTDTNVNSTIISDTNINSTEDDHSSLKVDYNAQYIRTDGYIVGEEYPKTLWITNTTELSNYYQSNKEKYSLDSVENPLSDQTIGFIDAVEKYDDTFFETNDLILIVLEEGSGSNRHSVKEVTVTPSGLNHIEYCIQPTIEIIVPEIGTCDMAEWHIIIEISKEYGSTKCQLKQPLIITTSSVVSKPTFAEYPEEAKYQYTGDFSELELCNYAVVGRIPCLSLDELVDNSDLIVLGTFVDDARQNCPTGNNEPSTDKVDGNDDVMDLYRDGASYNKLRIDKVFYGDIEAGEEIVICDDSYVTDGKLMYIASDTLTPMIKGEQWVYFLRKQSPEYGDCYFPLFTEGRYPVPGKENTFVLTGDSQHGVFDEKYFHEDIYEDVKKMLGYVDGVEIIDEHLEDDKKVFTMPEFPGEKFIWTKENISVCRKDTQFTGAVYTAPGITSLYLTDLNGDGKRELVTLGLNSASGLTDNLVVYDHANSVFYTLKNDTATNITNALEIRDNELYVVTKTLDDGKEVSAEPLTFDMLKPITQPGYILSIY